MDQAVQVLLVYGEPPFQLAHDILKQAVTLLEFF
jgi:hypothetical protein